MKQTQPVKEKVLSVRCQSEATRARLVLMQAKLSRALEIAQERSNQIFMFAEEMQLPYQSHLPANVVAATVSKEGIERFNDLRDALSSTQRIEEEAKSKCAQLEAECISVRKIIEETERALNSASELQNRQQCVLELTAAKDRISKEIEAAQIENSAILKVLADREALKHKENELDEGITKRLEEEQATWDQQIAALDCPHSSVRKAIAEEELALCDENFRQQVRVMREGQDAEISALENQDLRCSWGVPVDTSPSRATRETHNEHRSQ